MPARPSRGPRTAPEVSANRWKPKTRPRCSGATPGHQQRVTRSAAHALAQPVDHAPGEHDGPDRRDGDQDLAERCQAVAEADERTLRPPVGDTAGDELGQAGRAFRHALDDPDHSCRRAQRDRQEDRQDRIEHLARRVLQQAHAGKHLHVVREECSASGGHATIVPVVDVRLADRRIAAARCRAIAAPASASLPRWEPRRRRGPPTDRGAGAIPAAGRADARRGRAPSSGRRPADADQRPRRHCARPV